MQQASRPQTRPRIKGHSDSTLGGFVLPREWWVSMPSENPRRGVDFEATVPMGEIPAETTSGPEEDDLARVFRDLAQQWRTETGMYSAITQIVTHPAYQQIIGMGKRAIPWILTELGKRPDHWFWALRAITGESPVQQKHMGSVRLMAQDWLEWGRQREFVGMRMWTSDAVLSPDCLEWAGSRDS